MSRLLCALAIAMVGALPAAAQPRPPVAVVIPDAAALQRLTLADGSRLDGRVEQVQDDSIVFRTVTGAALTIPRDQITGLRLLRGRVVDGEFQHEDPHASRLFGGPTARAVRHRDGYVALHQIAFPSVQIGITDRLSVGAATLLIPVFDDQPFAVTPKLQLIRRDRVQVAAGTIHLMNVDDNDLGIGYAVATIGSRDTAGTVGLGFGYNGHEGRPVLLLGGERRVSRRVKWISENWIWGGDAGFVTGGARVFGERFAVDLGVMVPLGVGWFVAPVVSLAWSF